MSLSNFDLNATMDNNRLNLDNCINCDGENLSEMLQRVEFMKEALKIKQIRQQAKEMHPYSINHSERSGWYTDVKDSPESKRRKIIRKTEEDLLDYLVNFYNIKPTSEMTIKVLYSEWFKRKETPNNQETMRRYKYIWEAYYANEPLSQNIINKPINQLNKKELRDWAEELVRKHYPNNKKFNNMFSLMNQLFTYADEEDITEIEDTAIWTKAKHMINRKLLCPDEIIEPESQIFTDEEILFIKNAVREDLLKYKKQASSAGLQILFMIETAMRIGEVCGLQWKDIDFKKKILHISRQANNERVKQPKTVTSIRKIPLTDEAIHILQEVQEYNTEHNFNKEWVFQSSNSHYDYRLSYNAADRKLRKLCNRMADENEANIRSPHKLRKTTLSLLCDSVNIKTAQKFAGHKDSSTTQKFYWFDRSSEEERDNKIRQAIKFNDETEIDKTEIIAALIEKNKDLDSRSLAQLILNTLHVA